jgi:alpha-D-xyloside xylohydrolase
MREPIHWNHFVKALDYTTTHQTSNSLLRWDSWEELDTGVLFHCQSALEQKILFRIDVITPDIIRIRMNPDTIRESSGEMLNAASFKPADFTVFESEGSLKIETDRLQIVFPQQPWGMQVFDINAGEQAVPFFQEQNEDRAYGQGFEVPPVGFSEGNNGQKEVNETVAVQPGESFYGLGERFSPMNKWGQELEFWAVDSGNVSSRRAYKNIPFFISSAGYGLFVHTSFPMVFRMGSESNVSYSFHILDQQLDYFLLYGPDFKHILKQYTDLTGRAPVPPKWSFGFWISRCMYMSREETDAVVEGMRDHRFPCDVISLDPYWMGEGPWCTYEWDTDVFPDPEDMIRSYREKGIRTCLWVTSYLPKGSAIYKEAAEQGFLVKTPQGEPAPVLEAFTGTDLAAVDFTNQEAKAWWQSKLRTLLDMGVAAFKTDFAEQAPIDAVYSDGRSGLEMHNLYPLLYNQAAFELTREKFGRGLVWGRSAYAGSQRYPVQWGGDSYSHFGQIAGQLQGLLSYGMSGVPFCSHDVGGFDYPPRAFDSEQPETYPGDAEVYIRWLQFGAFSSHMRAHGKQPREPWEYGEQAEKIARKYLQLRYRLLPYIYSQAVLCTQTGMPMVRPMVLEYQSDPNTYNLDLQYLFGTDFLVAPVLSRNHTRSVYLPEGKWFDFWTKELLTGGRWIDVHAPLDTLPLWVRYGAMIPMGPVMDYVGQKLTEPLTIECYGAPDSAKLIVHDEDQPSIEIFSQRSNDSVVFDTEPVPSQLDLLFYGFRISHAEAGDSIPLKMTSSKVSLYGTGKEKARILLQIES